MLYYDQNKLMEVVVDVSLVGFGVIFFQEGKIVVYVSRLLI